MFKVYARQQKSIFARRHISRLFLNVFFVDVRLLLSFHSHRIALLKHTQTPCTDATSIGSTASLTKHQECLQPNLTCSQNDSPKHLETAKIISPAWFSTGGQDQVSGLNISRNLWLSRLSFSHTLKVWLILWSGELGSLPHRKCRRAPVS